jgi:phosphoribosylformylglycinamidine cyclo-ligase
MGVGMIAVLPQAGVEVALSVLADRGVDAWVAGEVAGREDGDGAVRMIGDYAG